MNYKVLLLFVTLGTTTLLSACTLGTDSGDNVVTVYSERHYDTDQQLFDQFTAETGIAVNVVKAQADELINRLETEGEDSEADLLIIADAGRLELAKDKNLLQAVQSDVLDQNIPENYRDASDYWYGLTMRARIVYHPDRVSAEELSTYEALATSQWEGRLAIRSSTNIYNQSLIASMIAINGEEATENFIAGLVNSFAREPEGNDRDQAKAVMAGTADVAIMNTYYMGKMANSTDELEVEVANTLEVFFPNQETTGTHVNVSAAGVTAHAPNKDNAIALLEFLSSEDAQGTFASANYEYPVHPNVEPSDLLQSWGDFVAQDIVLSVLGEHSERAAIIMDEQGWK